MGDYTTGSAAKPGARCEYEPGIAGGALGATKFVFLDEAQSPAKWELFDADSAVTANTRFGIVLTAATAEDERILIATRGPVVMSGASGSAGKSAFGSTNAGNLALQSDVLSGDYEVYAGGWQTSTIFDLAPHTTGIVRAA